MTKKQRGKRKETTMVKLSSNPQIRLMQQASRKAKNPDWLLTGSPRNDDFSLSEEGMELDEGVLTSVVDHVLGTPTGLAFEAGRGRVDNYLSDNLVVGEIAYEDLKGIKGDWRKLFQ